jgi:hypothetical protein
VNLRFGPERRVGLGYTATNSYLNPGLLVCLNRACQLELEYETDHTGNLEYFDWSQPLFGAWEFGLGIGSYEMGQVSAWSPLHRLARDRTLRRFHEDVLGEESLPGISGAPDDREVFSLSDFDGRRLTLEAGRHYWLPLRLDLTRYFEFQPSVRQRIAFNVGLHLAVPLEGDPGSAAGETAFARGVDSGLSANFVRARQITPNVASTIHVQIARLRSDVYVVNENSPLHGDDRLRSQYAVTWGLRFGNTFSGRAPCSVSLGQLTNSAHYDKQMHYSYDPLVFEGGNNLRGALAGANDYGFVSFACEYRQRHIQVAFIEDLGGLSQLIDDDGAGTSYDPDFAVSLSASWRLGAPAARAD